MRADNYEMGRQAMAEEALRGAGHGSTASLAALAGINQHTGDATGNSQGALMGRLDQLAMDRDFQTFEVVNGQTGTLQRQGLSLNEEAIRAERAYAMDKKARDDERNYDIGQIGTFGYAMYRDYRDNKEST